MGSWLPITSPSLKSGCSTCGPSWAVMGRHGGEVCVPTWRTLGLAPGHTLITLWNVSRYVTNHLQAEVLTVLHGLDCVPALSQENSMSQIVTVLSVLLVIKNWKQSTPIKDNKNTWEEKIHNVKCKKYNVTMIIAVGKDDIHMHGNKRTPRKYIKI